MIIEAEFLKVLILTSVIQNGVSSLPGRGKRLSTTQMFPPEVIRMFPPSSHLLLWDIIIKQELVIKSLKDAVEEDTKFYSRDILIKSCHSACPSCSSTGSVCVPAYMEWRNRVLAVNAGRELLLVAIEYAEAGECLCENLTSATSMVFTIRKANVAKPFKLKRIPDKKVTTAAEGGSVNMSFPLNCLQKGSNPKTITIHRAFDQSEPLIHNIHGVRIAPKYVAREDWMARARLSHYNATVEFQLQNIIHGDEGIYFSLMECTGSLSFYSKMELRVLGKPPETPDNICEPQMTTKFTWSTFPREMSNTTTKFITPFSFQICRSNQGQWQTAKLQCVSAKTLKKHRTLCVSDDDEDGGEKWKLDYLVDETCSWELRDPFLPDSESQIPEVNVTQVQKVGRCPRVFQPTTCNVDLQKFKHQTLVMDSFREVVGEELMSTWKSNGRPIEARCCQSACPSCQGPDIKCIPADHKMRSTVLAVTAEHQRLLMFFEYVEAKECMCGSNQSSLNDMFKVKEVNIAKPCDTAEGPNETAAVVTADEGVNVSMSFFHGYNEAPRSARITRPFEQGQLFVQGIKNILFENVDQEDWRPRSTATFKEGLVNLHLRNIRRRTDEGTYFCFVKFTNSSSCFSMKELRVTGNPSETTENRCVPQLTNFTWSPIPRETSNNTNFNITLAIQSCHPDQSQCQSANRHCVSATTRKNKKQECVSEDNEDVKAKWEVDYLEDETCSCGIRNPFKPDSEIQKPEINSRRVGKCPKECQPQDVIMPFTELSKILNKWSFLSLASFIKGRPLLVKRCRNYATPCSQPNMFCDFAEEKITRKVVKLRKLSLKIVIKFYEDSKCECRESKDLTYDLKDRTAGPLTITYVKTKKKK